MKKFYFFLAVLFLSTGLFAQFNTIDWTSYVNDKDIKLSDSELVEICVLTTENGNDYLYVAGQTHSVKSTKTFCNTNLGNGDAFIAKYSKKGKREWIRYLGGNGEAIDSTSNANTDWAYALTIDKAPSGKSRIYVGGNTLHNNVTYQCGDTFCNSAVYQPQPSDSWDAFLAKYDENGNLLKWTYFGGGEPLKTDTDVILSLDVYDHKIYAAGYTQSKQSTLIQKSKLSASYDTTYNGGGDGFIAVFDSCLSSLNYFTYYNANADTGIIQDSVLSPTGQDRIHCIKLADDGTMAISGTTKSLNGISLNTNTQYHGENDAIAGMLKMNAYGIYEPKWGSYIGGNHLERGRDIAFDGDMNVYVAGLTRSDSSTFHASSNAIQKDNSGDTDNFIAKFDSAGNCKWLTFFGGKYQDVVHGISLVKVLDSTFIGISGLSLNCNLFTANGYNPSLLQNLNGDTLPCPRADSLNLNRDAFVVLLTNPSSDSIQQRIKWGTFAGGSKQETNGPNEAFTGYGPIIVQADDGSLYLTFSTLSKDVGDAFHGGSLKIKGKYKGASDAVIQKYLPTSAKLEQVNLFSDASVKAIEIFPTPFRDYICINNTETEILSVDVFNLMGVYLFTKFGTTNDKVFTINLEELEAGAYLIRINEKEVSNCKLIIKQ